MILGSPYEAVVGSRDSKGLAAFLAELSFESAGVGELSAEVAAALYGLAGPAEEQRLVVPGAATGSVRLVTTPEPPRAPGPFDGRPLAIDLYTRDMKRSMAVAESAGGHLGALVEYALGDLEVAEIEVTGPDGLIVVFIEVSRRRPSVLDADRERLHSEVHSIVWAVPHAAEPLAFWLGAGLETLVDAEIRGPIISKLMGLPKPDVPVRFILLCDGDHSPARFELIEFLDDDGPVTASWPLAAGLHAASFRADDLEAAMAALDGASFGEPVTIDSELHGQALAVSAQAPGGTRFELWQLAED